MAVLTVSAEQSAGTACGCCRRGYWAVVEALIPKGSIAAVHTCSGLTPAPSSAASELPGQYDDAKPTVQTEQSFCAKVRWIILAVGCFISRQTCPNIRLDKLWLSTVKSSLSSSCLIILWVQEGAWFCQIKPA